MPTYVGIGTTVEHGMEVVGDAIVEGQEGGSSSTRVPFEIFSNVSGNSTLVDSRQLRLRVQPSSELSPDDSYVVDMGIQNTTDNFFFITAPQNTTPVGTQRSFVISKTSNVGVGTAEPLKKLHVQGDVKANVVNAYNVTGTPNLDMTGTFANVTATSNVVISGANSTLSATADIATNAVNTLMTSTGNLTTNAVNTLMTSTGDLTTNAVNTGMTSTGDLTINAVNTSMTSTGNFGIVTTSNTSVASSNTIVTSTANTFVTTNNLIINASNVGIGTATPLANLHVQGDFKATGNVEIGAIAFNSIVGAPPAFTITTSNLMALVSETVGITSNVGIGTNVPETALQVLGDVAIGKSGENAGPHTLFFGGLVNDASLAETVIENRTHDGGNGTELLLFKGNNADASNGYDRIRLRAGRIILDTFPTTTVDRTSENPRLTILEDGKVGIGRTDPEYRLDVSGSTRFDGGTMYFGTTEGLTSITTLRVTIGTQGGLGGTKQVQATWPNSYSVSARLMVQVTIDIDGVSNDDNDTFITTVTGVSTTGCKINVRRFNGGAWSTTLYAMVTVFELSVTP